MTRSSFTALLALVIAIFYGGLLLLWLGHSAPLHWFLEHVWGVPGVSPPAPWAAHVPIPFFDMEGVLSWRDCHLRGVDVMAYNACDAMRRKANYSPLIYLLPTGGVRNTLLFALAMDGVFLAALPLVLSPRSWGEFRVAVLAVLSHATVFALERANIDILMFLLMLAALFLWRRGRSWPALAAVLAAGLLKFYPLALLLVFAREKRRRVVLLGAVSLAVIAAFAVLFWRELMLIPSLLPRPRYFADNFGAPLIALAARDELDLPGMALPLLRYGLTLLSGLLAWRLSRRWPPAASWRGALFLGSAAILSFCFFASVSINYRAIFLLALLPGFFDLRGERPRLAAWGVAAVLFCLYSEIFRLGAKALELAIYGTDPNILSQEIPEVLYFLVREGLWWFLATVMLASVFAWVRGAPLLRGEATP